MYPVALVPYIVLVRIKLELCRGILNMEIEWCGN